MSLVPPKIAPFAFEESLYEVGEYASIICAVPHGDFPLSTVWKLNNQTIYSDSGIYVTPIGHRSSSLTIDSMTHEHAGNFTCRSENVAGVAEYTAKLEVNG